MTTPWTFASTSFLSRYPTGSCFHEVRTRQNEDQDIILDYAVSVVHEWNKNGLTMSEARNICQSQSFLPNNWDKGQDQLWAYLTLFSALRGHNHHVAIKIHTAIKLFNVGIQTAVPLATLLNYYEHPAHNKRASYSFEFSLSITLAVIWINKTVAGPKNWIWSKSLWEFLLILYWLP